MPIYEYALQEGQQGCDYCRAGFEEMQSMKDEALKVCPQCHAKVQRVITAPNVSVPRSNRELREKGFTKLVRRDKGVYEDVTGKGTLDTNK